MQFEDCWPQMCCHLFIFHVYLTHIERIQKPKFTTGYKRIHIVIFSEWAEVPLCALVLVQSCFNLHNILRTGFLFLRHESRYHQSPFIQSPFFPEHLWRTTSTFSYKSCSRLCTNTPKHERSSDHCCFHFGIHIENLLFILRYINQSTLKKTVISF